MDLHCKVSWYMHLQKHIGHSVTQCISRIHKKLKNINGIHNKLLEFGLFASMMDCICFNPWDCALPWICLICYSRYCTYMQCVYGTVYYFNIHNFEYERTIWLVFHDADDTVWEVPALLSRRRFLLTLFTPLRLLLRTRAQKELCNNVLDMAHLGSQKYLSVGPISSVYKPF